MSNFNNECPTFFKDVDILYEGSGVFVGYNKNQYHQSFRFLYFEDTIGIVSYHGEKYEVKPNQVVVIRPNRIYKVISENDGKIKYYDFNFLDKKSNYNIDKIFEHQVIYEINEKDYFSQCFKMALVESRKELGSKILFLSGIGFCLLSLVLRNMKNYTNDISKSMVSRNNIFLISEIENKLWVDFTNNSKVNNLAYAVGISENKLYKVIKDTFELSPKEWIMQLKIQKIKIMLVERKSYHEIAERLAFCSISHMSSVFKRYTGYTPNEYLKGYSNK